MYLYSVDVVISIFEKLKFYRFSKGPLVHIRVHFSHIFSIILFCHLGYNNTKKGHRHINAAMESFFFHKANKAGSRKCHWYFCTIKAKRTGVCH